MQQVLQALLDQHPGCNTMDLIPAGVDILMALVNLCCFYMYAVLWSQNVVCFPKILGSA